MPGALHGAAAQERVLRGVVVAAESGEAIARAEILVEGTQLRTVTDEEGAFEITLPAGTAAAELVVAATGFETVVREVAVPAPGEGDDASLVIELERTLFEVAGVTVTATRGNARPGEVPVSVSVMSGEELRRRDVTSLGEALPFAQGVTFNAGQMDIRGSSGFARGVGSRVLMLMDGHRMLAGTGSAIDFGILPLLDVERVEIVKGPHSTLFGNNAMGGVVNVITRPPVGSPQTVVQGYFGLYDTPSELVFTDDRLSMNGLQFQYARRVGDGGITVMAAREDSDGYRQNGGLERWRMRAKAVFGAESTTPWEVFASWKREDLEEFFTWRSADRRLEVAPSQLGDWKREIDLVAGMTATPLATARVKVLVRPQIHHVTLRNHFHDNDDEYSTTRYRGEVQISRSAEGSVSLTGGVDGALTTFTSNFLEPDPFVTEAGAFLQSQFGLSEHARGTFGARVDLRNASSVHSETSVNPKVGVSYDRWERLSLRASISRGYRAPSVAEQYTRATVFGFRVVPNLELRGESVWSGELGGTAQPSDRLWLDAAVFWSEYEDLIEVSGAPGQILTFQFRNVAQARVRGVDAGVRFGLIPRRVNLGATYLYLDPVNRNTSKPLAYRSSHNLTTTVSGWSERIAVDLRYRSRPDEVLAYPLDDRGSITVVDVRLSAVVMNVELRAKVANLLQTRYVDVQERNPGASRNIRLTVTRRF